MRPSIRDGIILLLVVALVWVVIKSGMLDEHLPPDPAWGRFSGNPKTELLPDGRKLKLLEEFTYTDPRNKTWVAPKNWTVDGASIPQPFWTMTGGPLEGPYRNASIVHDVGCDQMVDSWRDVHRMFYEAMRCGGVSENRAKTMYAAVYHFGPRWAQEVLMKKVSKIGPNGQRLFEEVRVVVTVPLKGTDEPSEAVREKVQRFIDEKNPSIEDIEKLDLREFGFIGLEPPEVQPPFKRPPIDGDLPPKKGIKPPPEERE